jgi:hypothetical protein
MEMLQTTLNRRERAAARRSPRCAAGCGFTVSHFDTSKGEVEHRGTVYSVCGLCRKRYSHILTQLAFCGLRFRFVEKSEIPPPPKPGWSNFIQIYKLLLLARERQISQGKEVNWMVDDTTRKILKLPDKIAGIVTRTFVASGDNAELSDDQALMMIKDLLEEIDPEIMTKKNKRKKLS